MANDGNLWIDNLYFAVSRERTFPGLTMLQYGVYEVEYGKPENHLYITNTTFVGEGRGSQRALSIEQQRISLLAEGSACSTPVATAYAPQHA